MSHAVASPGAGVCDDAERLSEYVLQTHEPKDAEVGLEGIELVDATGNIIPERTARIGHFLTSISKQLVQEMRAVDFVSNQNFVQLVFHRGQSMSVSPR